MRVMALFGLTVSATLLRVGVLGCDGQRKCMPLTWTRFWVSGVGVIVLSVLATVGCAVRSLLTCLTVLVVCRMLF